MNINLPSTLSAFSLAVVASTTTYQVHAEDTFYEAISSGKASLDSRIRYENVDQDGLDETTSALTVRTRLGYKTGELAKTTAFVEMSDTRVVAGIDDYREPGTPANGYPIVADPTLTELNQAYLSYQPIEGLNLIAGRQRLIIDNARFIGNVGWRQQEQTFDALTAKYKTGGFNLKATYSGQRNTIIGGHVKTKDIFLNTGYRFNDVGKLSAYYYALDDDKGITLDTLGLRFNGKASLGDAGNILYTAEYATQKTDSTRDKSADYMLAELGYGMNAWSLMAGMEVQTSDEGNYGFKTPYGTNHAFGGWADKFLATPDDGLEDLYVKAVVKAVGMKFVVVGHDYSGENSGDDLGSEINFVAIKPFAKKYKVGFKYANYSEGDIAIADTTKYWLWGEMKF